MVKKLQLNFRCAGTANISQEQKDFARKYSTPLDCTWIIRAEQQKVIYIQATITCCSTINQSL